MHTSTGRNHTKWAVSAALIGAVGWLAPKVLASCNDDWNTCGTKTCTFLKENEVCSPDGGNWCCIYWFDRYDCNSDGKFTTDPPDCRILTHVRDYCANWSPPCC